MNKQEYIDIYDSYMNMVERNGKEKFTNWLKNETDFFTAPASGKFHNNYEHGLFEHSINVLNYARNLYNFSKKNYPNFPEISKDSIIISALHHDICKTNFYSKQKAWVKKDYSWIEYEEYKAGVENKFPMGHGEKSVILMLMNGFELTEQEMLAIRHHMGKFENNSIDAEVAMKDPLVYLIHLSDMACGLVEQTIDYKELALKKS